MYLILVPQIKNIERPLVLLILLKIKINNINNLHLFFHKENQDLKVVNRILKYLKFRKFKTIQIVLMTW